MNEKVTVYLWYPNPLYKKHCGHLGIETKNIYVSFHPYDKPKADKTNPFLYTYQEDLAKEGRAPDVYYEIECLNVKLLEEYFTYFAQSDFDRTGIFDPERQTTFWEQLASVDINAIKKVIDSNVAEALKLIPGPIGKVAGFLTHPIAKATAAVSDFIFRRNATNLEIEVTYNWFTLALSILHSSGLLYFGKWKENARQGRFRIFDGLGMYILPITAAQVIPGTGLPLYFCLLCCNLYVDAASKRINEQDFETYLQNAMKSAPKNTINRFILADEIAVRNLISILNKERIDEVYVPSQVFSICVRLSLLIPKCSAQKQVLFLSEIPQKAKEVILFAIETRESPPAQIKAKL